MCATCVRRKLGLEPKFRAQHTTCGISITLLIDNEEMEFIYVYAPHKQKMKDFFEHHHPIKKCSLGGDFNTYQGNWYGERAIDCANLSRSYVSSAGFLTNRTEEHGLSHLNYPNHLTHFPRNGNSPSIQDTTFASGPVLSLVSSWSSNTTGGGDSDHSIITTLNSWHIDNPTEQSGQLSMPTSGK